jgi:hypothetical protein
MTDLAKQISEAVDAVLDAYRAHHIAWDGITEMELDSARRRLDALIAGVVRDNEAMRDTLRYLWVNNQIMTMPSRLRVEGHISDSARQARGE